MPEGDFLVSHHPLGVTVTAHAGGLPQGTVSASAFEQGYWYLNRLLVQPTYRGQGLGPALLKRLWRAFEERKQAHPEWRQQGPLMVEPGGYGSDPERLRKFYQREGFEPVEGEAYLVFPCGGPTV